jgi:hypothetical protein
VCSSDLKGGEEEFFATNPNNSRVTLLELCKKIILAATLADLLRSSADLGIGGSGLGGPGVGGKDLMGLGLVGLDDMFLGIRNPSIPQFNASNFGRPPRTKGPRGPVNLNLRVPEPSGYVPKAVRGHDPDGRGYKAARHTPIGLAPILPIIATYK